jgi:hypothetical protein
MLPLSYRNSIGDYEMSINIKNKWLGIFTLVGVLLLFATLYLMLFSRKDNKHLDGTDTGYSQKQENYHSHEYEHIHSHEYKNTNSNTLNRDEVNKHANNTGEINNLFQDLPEIKIEDVDEGVAELPDYFPIHEDSIGQMLSEIKIRNENLISKEQLISLRSVLKENILAYKHGSAEEILADRLRVPYSIKTEATHWHLDILKRHYTNSNEALPSDPEKILRLLVNRYYHGENGSGYKDLYNEISVEGSYLDFRQTNTMPKSITDYLWLLSDAGAKTFNNGVITPHPSIEYLNSPKKVLQKYGKLLYVDVSIAASDSQGQKYSRLKRYYWSEDDQVWLAMEVVSLRAKDRKADEFF